MKTAIVFNTVSGNTEQLATTIKNTLNQEVYFGKPTPEALEADVLFVGSWTMAFTCTPEIKNFLSELNNKKVFIFQTAGYGSTPEFYAPILESIKANLNDTNEVIGEFICQGKVSDAKREGIKKMDLAKYESMVAELDKAEAHPNADDLANLAAAVKALSL